MSRMQNDPELRWSHAARRLAMLIASGADDYQIEAAQAAVDKALGDIPPPPPLPPPPPEPIPEPVPAPKPRRVRRKA